jgi:hypothetical protein
MQEETQNNSSGWRSRLGDLEAPPAEGAWDKLYARLDNKKKSNKSAWWLLAAACAIFVFFLISFFKDNIKVTKDIIKTEKQTKVILSRPPAIVKKEALSEKKNILRHTLKTTNLIPKKETTTASIEVPIEIHIADTSSFVQNNIVSAAPKKKLRVVHINELEPANHEEALDWAQNEKTKSKRVKNKNLIHSYVSNSASDKALKIKLSPSN